jgi:hypothetical protein
VSTPALPYSQPSAGGGKFEPSEHNGSLLLFFPIRYNPEEPTKFGTTTSAATDVINVDTGAFISDALVFGNLANSLRNDCPANGQPGGVVLGRLGQGVNTKGNPPWILQPYTPEDAAKADPAHAAYKAGQFKQPAAAPASAAPAQYQAPPAAPASPPTAPPPPTWGQPAPAAPSPTPAAAPPAWGQPPAAAPPAPPTPAATPPASPAVDPSLVAFLAARGVEVKPGMDQATCESIARSFPN